MDTCAKKCSITFKTLRYIMSGSDNFLGCILCTPTLHFRFIIVSEYRSHKCICVGVRYYRWPSCKLPCFLLLLTPAIPNDASAPPVHSKPWQTMPGKSVLQKHTWDQKTPPAPSKAWAERLTLTPGDPPGCRREDVVYGQGPSRFKQGCAGSENSS